MFDNLRDDGHAFGDQDETKSQLASGSVSGPITGRSSRFMGMTAIQRFVIAVLLMAAVCVLGLMCLFVTGKIGF